MKTIQIKIYQFDELSDDAKEYAINQLSDINVDCQWYDCVYDDIKELGYQITEFDLYRQSIKAVRSSDNCNSIHGTIQQINHDWGKQSDLYPLVTEYYRCKHHNRHNKTKLTFDEEDFLHELQSTFLMILQKEYEYLTSKEAIVDTIKSNEYEFTSDGKMRKTW